MSATLSKAKAKLNRKVVIRHFYNNILHDDNLKNGSEKEVFETFCGWTVMMNRSECESDNKTLATETGYAEYTLSRETLPTLVKKGYLTILVKGGKKKGGVNIPTKYQVNIPSYYIYPEKRELDEATKIKMAKKTLIAVGVDPDKLNLLIAEAEAVAAINKSNNSPSLSNTVNCEKKVNHYKALYTKN